MREQIRQHVDHWIQLECSEKSFPCNPDNAWQVARDLEVDPYDVIHLFDYLKQGSYLPANFSLQFYQLPREGTDEIEFVMVVRNEEQTLESYPLDELNEGGRTWSQQGVYRFVESLLNLAKQEAAKGKSSSKFETVSLSTDDFLEDDDDIYIQVSQDTTEIQLEDLEFQLEQLLEMSQADHKANDSASQKNSLEQPKQEPKDSHITIDEVEALHNLVHIQEDEKKEVVESTKKIIKEATKLVENPSILTKNEGEELEMDSKITLPIENLQNAQARLDQALYLLDQSFESSVHLFIQHGSAKNLMRQLLLIEQELQEVKGLLGGASEQEA